MAAAGAVAGRIRGFVPGAAGGRGWPAGDEVVQQADGLVLLGALAVQVFGRTGSGRKGEATDTAEMFLRAAVWDWADISVTGLSSGEGLIERIRDPQSEEDDGGTMDKRLCVTETEFSTVMARAKREGSTLGTVLRQAWDARTLAVLTRVAYKASMPHVAIIGHIPPEEFRMRLAESDMVGGSYNRFLPVYVERSKKLPIPEGIPEPLLGAEAARLRRAIGAASDLGRIHLGEHATRLWSADLYDEFTAADDDDQAWTEFTRRAAPYCLRIAALHAALDGTAIIAASHLHAAAPPVPSPSTSHSWSARKPRGTPHERHPQSARTRQRRRFDLPVQEPLRGLRVGDDAGRGEKAQIRLRQGPRRNPQQMAQAPRRSQSGSSGYQVADGTGVPDLLAQGRGDRARLCAADRCHVPGARPPVPNSRPRKVQAGPTQRSECAPVA
jgi:hypothetical protein